MAKRTINVKHRISVKPWTSMANVSNYCCHAVYRRTRINYFCLICYCEFDEKSDGEFFKPIPSELEDNVTKRNHDPPDLG